MNISLIKSINFFYKNNTITRTFIFFSYKKTRMEKYIEIEFKSPNYISFNAFRHLLALVVDSSRYLSFLIIHCVYLIHRRDLCEKRL